MGYRNNCWNFEIIPDSLAVMVHWIDNDEHALTPQPPLPLDAGEGEPTVSHQGIEGELRC